MSFSTYKVGDWVTLLTHEGDEAEDEEEVNEDGDIKTWSEIQELEVGKRYQIVGITKRLSGQVHKIEIENEMGSYYHKANKFKLCTPVVRLMPWL
jgi:hypothetical protein